MEPLIKQKILHSLEAAHNVPQLRASIELLCTTLGFRWFLYAALLPVSMTRPYLFTINSYPQGWRVFYEQNDGMSRDPVIKRITASAAPFFWDDPVLRESDEEGFLEQAAAFGLKYGLSMSIRGVKGDSGALSLATDDVALMGKEARAELAFVMQWYLPRLHARVDELVLSRLDPTVDVRLTPREQSCLRWVGDGKTSSEIGTILDISERTVVFHLRNATTKLQAKNRLEAFSKALRYGKISGLGLTDEYISLEEHEDKLQEYLA